MATTKIFTAEELAELPDDGRKYELVRGELVSLAPTGRRSGRLGLEIGIRISTHVNERHLGEVYGADTGFLLERNPDLVLAPDASFVRADRLQGMPEDGYLPLAPDLAVEVISPAERAGHISEGHRLSRCRRPSRLVDRPAPPARHRLHSRSQRAHPPCTRYPRWRRRPPRLPPPADRAVRITPSRHPRATTLQHHHPHRRPG
jgi:hypothetical protein